MRKTRRAAMAAVLSATFGAVLFGPGAASAQQAPAKQAEGTPYTPEVGQPGKDVVWVPTPDEVVEKMLDMAQVTRRDRVVDLGSGDGKIAIAAARRGARAKGVEFNPDMVALSKRNAQAAGVNVDFVQGDIFKTDFSDADVLTLYLLPELNERLRPTILRMKPGTRVVSHQFAMGDWEPDEEATLGSHRALFWRVPARVAGTWSVQIADEGGPRTIKVRLRQRYQKVEGEAAWDGATTPVEAGVLAGPQLRFTAADGGGTVHQFQADASTAGRMRGTVTTDGGSSRSFQARRQ
jgi:SAM-dependent methyltransferase